MSKSIRSNITKIKNNLNKISKIDKEVLNKVIKESEFKVFLIERAPVNTHKLMLNLQIEDYFEFYKSRSLFMSELKKILEISNLTNKVYERVPFALKQYSESDDSDIILPLRMLDEENVKNVWKKGLLILEKKKLI
jgi:hypothetical protein